MRCRVIDEEEEDTESSPLSEGGEQQLDLLQSDVASELPQPALVFLTLLKKNTQFNKKDSKGKMEIVTHKQSVQFSTVCLLMPHLRDEIK